MSGNNSYRNQTFPRVNHFFLRFQEISVSLLEFVQSGSVAEVEGGSGGRALGAEAPNAAIIIHLLAAATLICFSPLRWRIG